MNRPNAPFRILIFSLFLAFLVAACGGDGDDVSAGAQPDDTVGDDTIPDDPDDGAVDDDAADQPDETLPDAPLGAGVLATIDVVITHPDADDVTYSVVCLGDTATLVGDADINEQTACSRLGDPAVRTRLLEGPPADQACTEQYGGPDVATITGTYDGVDGPVINTTVDRANGCGIADWDVLLSGVLPPAKGL